MDALQGLARIAGSQREGFFALRIAVSDVLGDCGAMVVGGSTAVETGVVRHLF